MATRIDKTIARLKQRHTPLHYAKHTIEEGQHYEAHQQLRVVSARYLKQSNPDSAIEILFSGAQSLLQASQFASGGDLALSLLEVYTTHSIPCDPTSKARIYTLLSLLPAEEPTRKKVINAAVLWSSKCSEYEAGDPDLHHFAGCLYAKDHEPYEAEKHLLLGTKDSCVALTNLLYTWYTQDEPSSAALYVSRAVLCYLLIGNVREASTALDLFTSRLLEDNKGGKLVVQSVETSVLDARIFPAMPLMNFLRLLCLAVTRGRGAADTYRNLRGHYNLLLQEVGRWDEALEQIAEMYFGIQVPRQRNFMADMMSSLFGGPPAAAGGGGRPQLGAPKPAAPPAVDLD
ncbi:hypothetical protein DRE_06222 [Drechslerella stenobrocha 248]|uniref:Golgi to ER traffic protein 4 n=1 Tax=Drechslerella stenobrocha 248 TaxID=1043628 RepID=W7HYR9_9PEZI|nr:hypothetical protein DRE_06222 [Drechslerella stenobrocha 248]